MRYDHKELIHDYLNLDRHIKRIEKRMQFKEYEFDNKNYYGGTVFSEIDGVRYRGFRIDSEVTNHIDLMNSLKKNIEMNKRKFDYFNQFLKSLDPHTRQSLQRRYKRVTSFEDIQELGHDEIVLDEVLEIEDAISFEFRTDLSDELKREVIKLEYSVFSQDTVEDSFQTMQKMLGVQ